MSFFAIRATITIGRRHFSLDTTVRPLMRPLMRPAMIPIEDVRIHDGKYLGEVRHMLSGNWRALAHNPELAQNFEVFEGDREAALAALVKAGLGLY